jgi:hypothetical protein
MNSFQGQCPKMAVRITATPTIPRIHRKSPEIRKARIINITPMISRKTPSPFPTFFTFTVGFSFLSSSAIDENPRLLPEIRSKFLLSHIPLYVVKG